MILVDIVNRNMNMHPWGEGEYVPHEDPDFSRKMLQVHLNQEHDNGSRRFEIIDRQVEWIHTDVLEGQPSKILQVGCGPGFHTNRLARLGHECVGIDVSPALIGYAREQALLDNLQCTYIEHDIYSADYGSGYGLVLLTYGYFNTFGPMDAYEIMGKAWRALEEGGILLLEVNTYEALESLGKHKPVWESFKEGLYSDRPYLSLNECIWSDANDSLTKRWFIVDTETAAVRYVAQCCQAYPKKYLQKLLVKRNFINVTFFPSPCGGEDEADDGFLVVSAEKTCKYS